MHQDQPSKKRAYGRNAPRSSVVLAAALSLIYVSLVLLFPPNDALAILTQDVVKSEYDPRLRKASRLSPAQNSSVPTNRPEVATKSDLITPSFGILLGMVSSHLEGIRLWRVLASRHGDLLALLRPRLFEAARSRNQTVYGVMAGPFDTSRAAMETCSILAARGVECSVTEFRGISPTAQRAVP